MIRPVLTEVGIFLIPFVLVGLVMIVAFLMCAFGAVRVRIAGAEGAVRTPIAGAHLCFRAPDRAAVNAFHAAALAAGGRDDGAPGLRPHYHADYYGGFVLDPDGHRIEAVCHAPTSPMIHVTAPHDGG